MPKIPQPFIDRFGPWLEESHTPSWYRYARPGDDIYNDGTLVLIYFTESYVATEHHNRWMLTTMGTNRPYKTFASKDAEQAIAEFVAARLDDGK